MQSEEWADALPDDGLSDDDRAFLHEWVATFGDGATLPAVRGRVRALLALRESHPARPPLAAFVDDPYVRAVLFAKPEGRAAVRARLLRRFDAERGR